MQRHVVDAPTSAAKPSTVATVPTSAAVPLLAVATVPAAGPPTPAVESLKSSPTLSRQTQPSTELPGPLPEAMDLRDRLFAGMSEAGLEDRDDEGAEVVIEPDGRVKVHPRRRPGYLRYGGSLEPGEFGVGSKANRGALERDAQATRDILLMRLLRRQRQGTGMRRSRLESLLEEEVGELLTEEAVGGQEPSRAFAGLETGSRADADSSSGSDTYTGARILTSPAGYFIAFIVGFGGILLIAMLCCVIRAAYVKRQKERLKKLLSEKLGVQTGEEPADLGLSKAPVYEVVESQVSTAGASEATASDADWIDVRVEQQKPPEEAQMMSVARLDTLSKAGPPAAVEGEKPSLDQVPGALKTKREYKHAGAGGRVVERETEGAESTAARSGEKHKSRKKSVKSSGTEVGKEDRKRKKAKRREKELKKVLSSKKTLRLAG